MECTPHEKLSNSTKLNDQVVQNKIDVHFNDASMRASSGKLICYKHRDCEPKALQNFIKKNIFEIFLGKFQK